MIVRDDQSGGYLAGILLFILIFIGMLVYFILNPPHSLIQFSRDLVSGDLLLLIIVFFTMQFLRWRQINRRRQEATRGNYLLIPPATIQPAPIDQKFIMQLPIRLKPNLLNRIGLYCLCVPSFLAIAFLTQWPNSAEDLWVFLLIWLVINPLLWLRRWFFARENIDITNKALQVNSSTMLWSDARLFAIRGADKPGSPALEYELASATQVLTWRHLRHRRRRWSLYKPPLPFEEYEQEMVHLLEFIAAKTNLPLYDVR